MSGTRLAAQSSPARMPASGPAKPATSSAITGRPCRAKRAGSPLALSTIPVQASASRTSTRSRMVASPMRMSALSPPPMRRAWPPARTSPKVGVSVVMHRGLAPMFRAFLLDQPEVLVEHDAVLPREGDEALPAGAPDQGEAGLARELHPPGREARPRHQDGNAHAHGLDDHLGGQPSGGIEDLVVGLHLVLEHPSGDLVDRIMATDVLHIDERAVALRQHAAVDRAGFEIER